MIQFQLIQKDLLIKFKVPLNYNLKDLFRRRQIPETAQFKFVSLGDCRSKSIIH